MGKNFTEFIPNYSLKFDIQTLKMKLLKLSIALISVFSMEDLWAQKSFSAKEAVAYALENNPNVKNAKIETKVAEAKVSETIGIGLPQISGSTTLLHYPQVQPFIIENTGTPPFGSPEGIGDPIAFALQLKNSFTGSIEAKQMIFNGSYLVGLKASRTYKELSAKQLKQVKEQIAEGILKSYYSQLVNEEKAKLLDLNISRLDSTYRETQQLFKNGFVEQIDLNRILVTLNNLKAEKQKTIRMLTIAAYALKLQMGMAVKDSIILTSKLDEINTSEIIPANTVLDYGKRSDYSILQTQKSLAHLQVQNIKSQYLPSLFGLATYGFVSAASKFENLGNFNQKNRYAPYNFIGINLSVPVFDGFQKKHQITQKKLEIEKINNGFKQLENAIDLELNQANINLANAQTNMDIQKRNLDLAKEVVRVAKVKYKQGVGSNLEVTNAESSLKESQTNYYTALYDFMVAKIDLDKAQGQLIAE
jgi:outer membrane protein TolC